MRCCVTILIFGRSLLIDPAHPHASTWGNAALIPPRGPRPLGASTLALQSDAWQAWLPQQEAWLAAGRAGLPPDLPCRPTDGVPAPRGVVFRPHYR